MPLHFSPSRSLKYCFMTLRTVEDSSFSRMPPSPLSVCLRCKGDLFFIIFERAGMREQLVEEASDRFELELRRLERVHARAEDGRMLEALRVPADVLARDAHAALDAVELVQLVQVPHEHLANLGR